VIRRLRESIFRRFLPVREAKSTDRGIGTPSAEYAEEGPYHCSDCVYIAKRNPEKTMGLCFEKHMLQDAKTGDVHRNANGLAIVNLQKGCCRYVKVPRGKTK